MRYLRPNKDDNKIYYYCKLSTALEFILPYPRLLLGPIINTNDPRENKSPLFTYNNNQNGASVDLFDLNEKCNLALKEDCKIICFSKDYKNYQGCHLSKMWAHYGDNHKGICLEIDRQLFIKDNLEIIKNNIFKEIIYAKPYHMNRSTQLNVNLQSYHIEENLKYLRKDFRQNNSDQLYFTKNDEWEAESEVRLVVFSEIKENEYCSIESSLKQIHLGVDFHDSYLPAVEHFSKNRYLSRIRFLNEALISQSVRNRNFS